MTRLPGLLTLLAVLVLHSQLGYARAADKPLRGTLDANGVKIAYGVQGKGQPVLLIHGWLSSAGLNWDLPGITSLLAKDYQVIEFDVRGHGLSGKPTVEDAYGPELVEDIVRLLDHLHIKKAHVVGYSMGSIITARFIAKHQDRVLSGTLGGMGWLKAGDIAQWSFAQIGKNDPNAKALAVCGRSLAKLALTKDEITSIRVPMTILVGDKDGLVKNEALYHLQELQRLRKDWPVVEIKDGDHISCILKKQFKDELAAWLAKNSK